LEPTRGSAILRVEEAIMCGIVGYIGERRAKEILLDGLKRLEYRGYDSAGIALIEDGELLIVKRAGKIRELEEFISQARRRVREAMDLEAERSMFSNFDLELIADFFKEPYVTIPRKPQEWYVIAPKFINFQIGWLEKSTRSYNVFLVNKYMHWLAQIPAELREQFDFQPELPVKVYDGMVLTGREHQEEVWNRYRKHLSQRVGKDRIRVKRGHEFHLIADMIDDGTLPFMPHPVADEDLRSPPWREPVELRD
jgi:hypothetical protein